MQRRVKGLHRVHERVLEVVRACNCQTFTSVPGSGRRACWLRVAASGSCPPAPCSFSAGFSMERLQSFILIDIVQFGSLLSSVENEHGLMDGGPPECQP